MSLNESQFWQFVNVHDMKSLGNLRQPSIAQEDLWTLQYMYEIVLPTLRSQPTSNTKIPYEIYA